MAKKFLIGLFSILVFSSTGFSQFSLGGGASSFHGLNMPINRYGFNLFGEFPRTTNNTFMIRAAYMLPNKYSTTQTVSGKSGVYPSIVEADLVAKTSYFAVDGGTRYYFINDYDIGFAMYAGGYIKGILSSFSATYRLPGELNVGDYETSDYPPQPLNGLDRQFSVLFAFGGTIGAKYQLSRGALTLDFGIEFISRLMDPYFILGTFISPLSFNVNLAYRFDWF